MKIYLVGGAVRDKKLGIPVKDRDYLVVGSTPEEMIKLGYKPIGKNFPVFLHPKTNEEYALARTEKKIGKGYHGFEFYTSPTVTLEEDLMRRDITINAIAEDDDGNILDKIVEPKWKKYAEYWKSKDPSFYKSEKGEVELLQQTWDEVKLGYTKDKKKSKDGIIREFTVIEGDKEK